MAKINLLACTDRPDSNALKLARFIAPKYEAVGAEIDVISLEEYPVAEIIGGSYNSKLPGVAAFNERLLDADGIVFIVPEYNGSFPGILKFMMDYMPFPVSLDKFPVAFIGEAAGAFGGLRAVEHLQGVCGYRNAMMFPERVFIQRVSAVFTPENGISHQLTADLLDSQIANFHTFAGDFSRRPK